MCSATQLTSNKITLYGNQEIPEGPGLPINAHLEQLPFIVLQTYVKFYRREGENTTQVYYYNKSNIQHAPASLGEPVDAHTAPMYLHS